jgi:hypothetical protein
VAEVVVKAEREVLVNVFIIGNNLHTNAVDVVLHAPVKVEPRIHIQGAQIQEVVQDIQHVAVLALVSRALVESVSRLCAQLLNLVVPECVNSVEREAT